jgi:Phytanoyl-CoA dioxygenase (PhyH)
MASVNPVAIYTLRVEDRPGMIEHFRKHGWVAVEALEPADAVEIAGWVDEIACLPDGAGGILQHFEGTDAGPMLCRSENFVPIHDELRGLLCQGPLVEVAGALLGEPAVLYKEKVNYKLAGGAGFSPHQDAPAYPLIRVHVSAMVAVDDADDSNGGLEVVSGRFDELLPLDERGCIEATIADSLEWTSLPVRAGQTLWFHSWTPHRSGPNRSGRPRRALYPTYNAASEGDLRSAYYDAKRAAFAPEHVGDRARVSLINDFEGRPV